MTEHSGPESGGRDTALRDALVELVRELAHALRVEYGGVGESWDDVAQRRRRIGPRNAGEAMPGGAMRPGAGRGGPQRQGAGRVGQRRRHAMRGEAGPGFQEDTVPSQDEQRQPASGGAQTVWRYPPRTRHEAKGNSQSGKGEDAAVTNENRDTS